MVGRAPTRVAVVTTGTANTASVLAGLRRAGAQPYLCDDAAAIESAERVVLPGVGAFAAALRTLHERGLCEPLRRRLAAGAPTLCVCLGMQLLCAASEESPGKDGLGLVAATVRRFDNGVRVPQLGWNRVVPDPDCRLLRPGAAYFANSYRLVEAPAGWDVAWSDHGARFVAAMERGSLLACQFHPELSDAWGLALIERWLSC